MLTKPWVYVTAFAPQVIATDHTELELTTDQAIRLIRQKVSLPLVVFSGTVDREGVTPTQNTVPSARDPRRSKG